VGRRVLQAVLWGTHQYQTPPQGAYHQLVRLPVSISADLRAGVALPARPTARQGVALIGLGLASLSVATLLVALLEGSSIGIQDASPVYLLAVVAIGAAFGTVPALAMAVIAFLAYDILFTEPRLSLAVADPQEWLDLLLFLFVAIAIGRLVAVQHRRAEEADRRAHEANSLFALSRVLATAPSTEAAAIEIAQRLTHDAALRRVWIVAATGGQPHRIADSDDGPVPAHSPVGATLVRTTDATPARWVRVHGGHRSAGPAPQGDADQVLVRLESDGMELGTLFGIRDRARGLPTREETRILALAADQLALALRRDQLRRAATEVEIARQGDALKTALIDSVSHDLRTPLASIRATAGSLADADVDWPDAARREAATLIDAEAARLDRLVRGVLDLSRIETGTLHPDLEPHDLASIVEPIVARSRPALGARSLEEDVPDSLPPVLVDAVLLDVILTNLLDNAAVHAPPPALVRVSAVRGRDGSVRLTVEDGGPGVPENELPRLFERFHRVPRALEGSRRGLGIGLSVVRGLSEAMGATVEAGRSAFGGLAITIVLRVAPAEPGNDG
jgi:two-component system, OmpR family, sensor histidine kinase KdpD